MRKKHYNTRSKTAKKASILALCCLCVSAALWILIPKLTQAVTERWRAMRPLDHVSVTFTPHSPTPHSKSSAFMYWVKSSCLDASQRALCTNTPFGGHCIEHAGQYERGKACLRLHFGPYSKLPHTRGATKLLATHKLTHTLSTERTPA